MRGDRFFCVSLTLPNASIMNYLQIALSYRRVVACSVIGGIAFSVQSLRDEFSRFPTAYRSQESVKSVMPGGMAATFVAMLALVFYGLICRSDSGIAEDAGAAAN